LFQKTKLHKIVLSIDNRRLDALVLLHIAEINILFYLSWSLF